jgi:hypothetical protein
MEGLVKPCSLATFPLNTGIDCQAKMGPTAMLIMVPASAKWQDSDELSFLSYAVTQMHAAQGSRWYPMLGKNAPIRSIEDAKEADVLQTFEDGATAFVRSGMYARTFMTNNGGLAFGQALRSFNGFTGFAFIEIAKNGVNLNVLRMRNEDGSLSGIPVNLAYAPTPKLATLKEVYENAFYLNFSPDYYIGKSEIAATEDDLLGSLTGLINVAVTDAGSSSTTILKVDVRTLGTDNSIVPLYSNLSTVGNFIVTDHLGAVTAAASAAKVSNHVELTGTWTAGKWTVALAPAATLAALTPAITGFEGTKTVTITTA